MGTYIAGNTTKFMDSGFNHYDFSTFADMIGFDSNSSFSSINSSMRKIEIVDMMASVSDKPLYNCENHILSSSSSYAAENATRIYNDLYQQALHGLDASTIWAWSRSNDSESDLYGAITNRPDCLVAAA